jgi:hypothetical protein
MMPDILHGQAWEQEVNIGIVKPNGLLKTEKKTVEPHGVVFYPV